MTSLPDLLEIVCDICRVTEADVRSHTKRPQPVVDAKHAFVYAAKVQDHTSNEIALFLGLDVNTVNYRHRAAQDRMSTDIKFQLLWGKIWSVVNSGNGDHILHASRWKCSCGEHADPMDAAWKWNGKTWQHQHEAKYEERR